MRSPLSLGDALPAGRLLGKRRACAPRATSRLGTRAMAMALIAGALTTSACDVARITDASSVRRPGPASSPHPDGRQQVPAARSAAVTKDWKVPQLRVMPLGDSITYGDGSSHGGGYRADLWTRLAPHTDRLDFVGSRRDGRMADPDHEGHWGWKIGGLSANVDQWLPAAKPNVVLLHIGTNDMNENQQVDEAPRRLGELIDKITSIAPGVTVLVSSLVPSSDAGTQKRIERFNAAVPRLVSEQQGKGRHVGYVDMSEVTTRDLNDDLHPKDSGYVKMADAFSNAVARAAADGWIRERVETKPAPPRKPAPPADYRVDINSDGKADYLVVHDNGAIDAWLNNGGTGHGGWTQLGNYATGVGQPGNKVRLADINADGKADYLILHDNGAIDAWLNNGGTGHGGWTQLGNYATGVG
ncbi:GDSL-type esterase/lipase family protein, partial [Streptomyces sp. NPDC053048]|uniref:GDSL-type esterase/lipase family protein n=1 Tax=Streptomyces sp. NPDC053048 TaxID=3365694 RepID=UPI0037D87073